MRLSLSIGILFISLTAVGQSFEFEYHKEFDEILAQTKDSTSSLHYDKLLQRFQRNDSSLSDFEVLALLIGFTGNEYFKPYSYLSTEREINALNGDQKFQEAIAMSDSFLIYVPVSQATLFQKSYAFYKLGLPDSAQYYFLQNNRIIDAMAVSGKGTSPETAFFSLGPADGQNFIRNYLSADIGIMGSGSDAHGNFVDILEMIWEDEETGESRSINLYFQIDHASKTMFEYLDLEEPEQKVKKQKRKQKK